MFLPYFCTPFKKGEVKLVPQLVKHTDLIGRALGSKNK